MGTPTILIQDGKILENNLRKMKFDKVSKPSHLANVSNGPGIIAIIRKTIGSNSQATELLMEREFRFRQMIMIKNKIIVAIVISI